MAKEVVVDLGKPALEMRGENGTRATEVGRPHRLHVHDACLQTHVGFHRSSLVPIVMPAMRFGVLKLTCRSYRFPEVLESIFESHQFLFNDFFSAHRFFVYNPSPYIPHMRHLDLSLNLPFHEYAPFVAGSSKSRVRELWKALGYISCLHTLRISLDIYDRGAWRKIPEQRVAEQLKDLKVLRKFTLELPPSLPIKAHIPNMENLDAQDEAPFTVVRRPPLRYWQFTPGQVERFTWDTHTKGQQTHCFITLAREARNVPNPYLLDFF